jgi:hypothetical protein
MKINERDSFAPSNARDWFERRSYGHEEFKDVKELAHRKRELGLTVSLVLPSRNVADTVGGIIETVNILNEEAALLFTQRMSCFPTMVTPTARVTLCGGAYRSPEVTS